MFFSSSEDDGVRKLHQSANALILTINLFRLAASARPSPNTALKTPVFWEPPEFCLTPPGHLDDGRFEANDKQTRINRGKTVDCEGEVVEMINSCRKNRNGGGGLAC